MCDNCDKAVRLIEMTLPANGGGIVQMSLGGRTEPVLVRDGQRYVLRRKDAS